MRASPSVEAVVADLFDQSKPGNHPPSKSLTKVRRYADCSPLTGSVTFGFTVFRP